MKRDIRLGLITIGQSPRNDILPEFIETLGFSPQIIQRGLLDGLTKERIASLSPDTAGEALLVSRLNDGSEVKLSEYKVFALIPEAIEALEKQEATIIALFCTGKFPLFRSKIPIVYPSEIMSSLIHAVFCASKDAPIRMGIVGPALEQKRMVIEKWGKGNNSVCFEALSPYTADESEMLRCAQKMAGHNCDVIILDCMGFTGKAKEVFAAITHRRIILPRSLLARIIAEISS